MQVAGRKDNAQLQLKSLDPAALTDVARRVTDGARRLPLRGVSLGV
jgi:hypothetical protein